jgi:predicted double-glycine peptidase
VIPSALRVAYHWLRRQARVPDVRQTTDYSCGASALQAVLAHYGIDLREDRLTELAGTTSEGTNVEDIARAATQAGVPMQVVEGATLGQLRGWLDAKLPVIIAIQAWREEDAEATPYAEDWENGHYVVAVGYSDDEGKVYFEDPAKFERAYITYDDLEDRWHDVDRDGRIWDHVAIVPTAPRGKQAMIVSPDNYLYNEDGEYVWSKELAEMAWGRARVTLRRALKDPKISRVVLMIGVPASGKSTWLRSNHQPDTVYFDATFTSQRARAPIIEIAKQAGKKVDAVLMTTPINVCIDRNQCRTPDRQVPEHVIESMATRLIGDLPTKAEGFTDIIHASGV